LIHIVYPEIPPTSNKLYIRGTIKTQAARIYLNQFVSTVIREHGPEINKLDPNSAYWVYLRFYFKALQNKNWNHPDPRKRPKSRYKKIDLDNRVKIIVDSIKTAIGIDDSQIFAAGQDKFEDPSNQRVEVFLEAIDPERYLGGEDAPQPGDSNTGEG